jgi:hypothetical protein
MGERIKVLITVKTYPSPSQKHEETVCTAGVREDGSFIRLYPIDYRRKPYYQWYKKYQWIELEVGRQKNDPRPESLRPLGDIKVLGSPLGTVGNWAERRKYVLAGPRFTMCELEQMSQKEISLAIVKPRLVQDFIIEEVERHWKPEWETKMKQDKLFGPDRKPLEKIPYKFSYKFTCEEPGCNGHKKMIEDWEVGQLYRNMRDKTGDERTACEKVRDKFHKQICANDKDTHFFVGTVLKHGTWVILGTFYPKKDINTNNIHSCDLPKLPF